jgi:cytoskeletal protein CcmA (bactofilin family)
MGLALLVALAPTRTFAADIRQGDVVMVGPTQTINDDLYAFGETVDIQGQVNGDVVAAGGTVTIHGTVTGDLLAAGGTTTVAGRVGGTVRAAGGTITIHGPVGKDVLVTGGTVRLEPGARVGRDLLTGAGAVILAGQVARNVHAGNGMLRLDDGTVVGGNLTYSSDQTAQIAPGARVQGTITQHAPPRFGIWPAGALGAGADQVIGWLRALVGLSVLSVLFVLVAPGYSRRTADTLGRAPWLSLALGLALLIGVPIAAFLVFVLGLFIGGWWLALIAMALYASALMLGIAVSGLFLGRWLLERTRRRRVPLVGAVLLGLVLLLLVGVVPVAGGLVVAVAMLAGLGALVVTALRSSRPPTVSASEPIYRTPVGSTAE